MAYRSLPKFSAEARFIANRAFLYKRPHAPARRCGRRHSDLPNHAAAEKAGPKTINDEVLLLLLRLCGDQGDLIRAKLRREKAMKLALPPSPGRAYTADEKARMLAEAAKLRSKNMYPALVVDLNCGLRDKELRELRWRQVDLIHKKYLIVGKSKTDAGTGRVIPLNETVLVALEAHAAWYIRRFGA